jgi:superfamily I DNA and/or RNA helicase
VNQKKYLFNINIKNVQQLSKFSNIEFEHCTCISLNWVIFRLVSASFERNFFTHVFIDEGAHAIEPECIIPITGLLDDRNENCGQLVIAGDPKQLGPILRSQFARNFGLGMNIDIFK